MVNNILIIESNKDTLTDKDFIVETNKRLSYIEEILKITVKRKVKDKETIINK